ncbi:uncharacterized protein LOC128555310 isoform X2 [Mercenaria mercenaria]|uniref:uncharacterized protein LOC128555310 isoform X2 n=1 Tax=Mercenaria mercenaria TaxID=6596 RepID=UPI00234F49DB|nr:uncharacterized protein LOC128555310 isoform X2 [Mercenaria mercenaria]
MCVVTLDYDKKKVKGGRGVKRRRQRDNPVLGKRRKLQLGSTILVASPGGQHPPIQEREGLFSDRRGDQLCLPEPNLYLGRRTLRVRHSTGVFDIRRNVVTLHTLSGTPMRTTAVVGLCSSRGESNLAGIMNAVILTN